jgi:hypothetical protein
MELLDSTVNTYRSLGSWYLFSTRKQFDPPDLFEEPWDAGAPFYSYLVQLIWHHARLNSTSPSLVFITSHLMCQFNPSGRPPLHLGNSIAQVEAILCGVSDCPATTLYYHYYHHGIHDELRLRPFRFSFLVISESGTIVFVHSLPFTHQ